MRRTFFLVILCLIASIAILTYFHREIHLLSAITVLVLFLGLYDIFQTHHAILRNFPVLGHFRYFFEFISPEIQQYFVERSTDGAPISRNHRTVVYERSKDIPSNHPFGTELDLYTTEYRGIRHSMYPAARLKEAPRVQIGGSDCRQPYSASLLNISAMSFGAISKNAILALNAGAKMGGFYHNTGEGGLTEYHLESGGDVVWQIGTGYFGCRRHDGHFDPEQFASKAKHPHVKMIELKLSQGAKPGLGGILPAIKNTPEIARIRGIEPGIEVVSPPAHREFSDAQGLLQFIRKLRTLSEGKPVGFKLCLGREDEFTEICAAMKGTGILPDFITIDGAEGGTGAAPLEFSDSLGIPLLPALQIVDRKLREHGLRDSLKVISSGKAMTASAIVRQLALGADLCNTARGFMLSLGCIQALRCHQNKCPTGVATQNERLVKGLVVTEKKHRVANFQKNTVIAVLEVMAACGLTRLDQIHPGLLYEESLPGVEAV